MAKRVCVSVSHHVSGFWKPVYTDNPVTTGSVGAGLLLDPYVEACCEARGRDLEVRYLGKPVEMPPAELVRQAVPGECSVSVSLKLEPGVGYAVSAASAVAAALCCSALRRTATFHEALRAAHVAEVECATGLGDVSAIASGRFLPVRLRPGAPGVSVVDSVFVEPGTKAVTLPLRAYPTKLMLAEKRALFEEHGEAALKEFLKRPSLERFLAVAREFSEKTGQMREEHARLAREACEGVPGVLGYFVKKGLLVVVAEGDAPGEVARRLSKAAALEPRVHEVVELGIKLQAEAPAETSLGGSLSFREARRPSAGGGDP